MSSEPQQQLKQIEEMTSSKFLAEIKKYLKWAEDTEQAKLLDVGFMENNVFFSVVIVTSENIVQLIFNRENDEITIGTASRDACEYAMSIWQKQAQASGSDQEHGHDYETE